MSTKFKGGDIICDTIGVRLDDINSVLSVIDVKTTKQGTQYYIVELCEDNRIDSYQAEHIDNNYSIQLKFKVGDIIRGNKEVSSENDRVVVGIVTSSKGNKSYLIEFANSGHEVNAITTEFADEYFIKIGEYNADRATDTRTA
jgi:hypothetical protein